MGLLAKFLAFIVILGATYVGVAAIISVVASSAPLMGFRPASTPYTILLGEALTFLSFVCVLTVFTIPATLAMFGLGGAWFRRVVARSAKGLGSAMGATVALYLGVVAFSGVQAQPSFVLIGESAALIAAGGVLVLAALSRGTLLKAAESLAGSFLRIPFSLPAFRRGNDNVAAVELRLAPTKRLREKSAEPVVQEEVIRLQRLVRSLASLGRASEFKLSFRGRRGSVLLLAGGRGAGPEIEQRLLSVARTYFPDSSPAPVNAPEGTRTCRSSVLLTGVPQAAPNPLEPVARFFLENGLEGDYTVILRRHTRNPISRLIASREQRRLARVAAEQKSIQSIFGEQVSFTAQDRLSELGLEEAAKRAERGASPDSVDVWVYVDGFAPTREEAAAVAETAARVVQASLSSYREKEALKVRKLSRPFQDLKPAGSPGIALAAEAAPLFWVPQMAMGTEVSPAPEFELPPPLEGEIELGEVVLQSGKSGHQVRVRLDDLTKHVFVCGKTGSGKTTTCFNLLIQLHRLGVPFLVIEPVKSEYRSLASSIPGLQVFTLGDEDTAPFRLNIFEPPEGVKVQTHIENLEASWNGSFVMYAPLPYLIKQILFETYKASGWDVRRNLRGRPITLEDFRNQAERVARNSGYEPKVVMDIEAALKHRITSLAYGGQKDLFDAITSISVETVLRRPTVLELKGIANPEEKAFVAALVLSNVAERLEARGPSKELWHFTLVEEAHRLLPNVPTQKGDPETADPRKRMVEQFGNMLAEVRAYGEGLAIVEQIPTKILPDAIKNTGTKIVHLVPAADDREVMAGSMGMTDDQSQALTSLKPGEAVVHLQAHPLPIRIAVPDRLAALGIEAGEMRDSDVKRLMEGFYLKNPLPRAPPRLTDDRLRSLVYTEWFRTRFLSCYKDALRTGSPDGLLDLVTQLAKGVSSDEGEFALNVEKVLKLGVAFYLPLNEEDREGLSRKVMRCMEGLGSGRKG